MICESGNFTHSKLIGELRTLMENFDKKFIETKFSFLLINFSSYQLFQRLKRLSNPLRDRSQQSERCTSRSREHRQPQDEQLLRRLAT